MRAPTHVAACTHYGYDGARVPAHTSPLAPSALLARGAGSARSTHPPRRQARRECGYPSRGGSPSVIQHFAYMRGVGGTIRRDDAKDRKNYQRTQQALAAIGLDDMQRCDAQPTRSTRTRAAAAWCR
eukprot:2984380-Prymnesium_polylepis.1